ncbi:hypothetical protein [Chryseobacterium polytrichastri]|uniref:Uncharacterized protein n=1 Tax=Chryseobacterium polytrichastri TaxID=1302687 RepID=A0A1M7HZ16_9FLAO|nr:hypothetical protein [Chryseobacterium polytrichastri]SHM33563.1 hypothetical protein SAMN05444267_104310 [Chryseobacterium polytrichastri]
MPHKINWKFSDKNSNLLNSKDKIEDGNEMFEIIDKAKKDELQEVFNTAIDIKYDLYKKYLFENNLFLFRSLENNIKESIYCLIIGIHTASITNTNLILERAIKLALIQYQAEDLLDYSDEKIIQKYIDSDKKYSGRNLDENIQTCQKFKIFSENEAKELKEYKIKFRDGFSHFTPKNILRGEKSLIHISGNLIDEKMETHIKLPTFQVVEL